MSENEEYTKNKPQGFFFYKTLFDTTSKVTLRYVFLQRGFSHTSSAQI